MKEKSFIQPSELGEVMEMIAQKVDLFGDKLYVEMTIEKDTFYGETSLKIDVLRKGKYDRVESKKYTIVKETQDSVDVCDSTICAGLAAIEKLEVEEKEEQERIAQMQQEESETNQEEA